MDDDIDTLSEEIDKLILQNLDLMEEKICKNLEMEQLLKGGHIELAKTKYIRGKENISMLQVPNNEDTVTSLFDLETLEVLDDNYADRFDINLKKLNGKADEPKDPIKWFGLLVPQNLKTSQQCFQRSIYLAVSIANIQANLVSLTSKLEKLYTQKDNLRHPKQQNNTT
ncbi:hypothetical protein DMN91_002329 [Ooceraea biroi]|uniref:Vacuolar ATPase assembly protein VMA22 n=1 Tax=Ooceraea biroi TaxID=2015173 RepID=A0A026W5I6_OOCBI|nr:coiled-coil domain-containing protein 115 [Ooceraea biroi]EZA51337.1 Coiled-coil domain-containing protein [Ooceraea biroi]RLU26163.1 hypothetical protein DMN91_002329 [Ooceraea biroi]